MYVILTDMGNRGISRCGFFATNFTNLRGRVVMFMVKVILFLYNILNVIFNIKRCLDSSSI